MKQKLIDCIDGVLKHLPWGEITPHTADDIAERLIENGVTIATGTNVGDKWISVKDERKPKNGEETLVVVFNGYETYIDIDFLVSDRVWYLESENRKVTHWMPLPEPPKEDMTDECLLVVKEVKG